MELMVTVAVISALGSLLLPALSRARAQTRQAQCLSSLRQLGLACALYWDDYQQRAFRYRTGKHRDGVIYWFGWLQDGREGERAFDPAAGALQAYLTPSTVGLCPSLRYASSAFKLKASGPAWGFGYNLNLSAPPASPAIDLSLVADPSRLGVFADSAQINTFQLPATPERPLLEEFYYVHQDEPTVHFRHEEKAQLVFADGHASGERLRLEAQDLRLPAARVGRLPAEKLILQPGRGSSR